MTAASRLSRSWLAVVLALGACAGVPTGPGVTVLPGTGKGFDLQCMYAKGHRVPVFGPMAVRPAQAAPPPPPATQPLPPPPNAPR